MRWRKWIPFVGEIVIPDDEPKCADLTPERQAVEDAIRTHDAVIARIGKVAEKMQHSKGARGEV